MMATTCSGSVRVVDARSPLAALVSRPAFGVPDDASLRDAAEVMREQGVSALLVHGRAGIVTERDIARAVAAGVDPGAPVDAIASRHPVRCPASTPVTDAAAVMLNEQVRHLVVDLGDRGCGIVSIRDVLAVLLQASDRRLWLTSLRVAVDTPAEVWLG